MASGFSREFHFLRHVKDGLLEPWAATERETPCKEPGPFQKNVLASAKFKFPDVCSRVVDNKTSRFSKVAFASN